MKKSNLFYLLIVFLIQVSSSSYVLADEESGINFTLSNNINTNCDNKVILEGVNTHSINQVLLDDEVVWDSSDIFNEEKTIALQNGSLSFILDSCPSESIHMINAIFENGSMVSQFFEINSHSYANDSDENQIIPKAVVYWASRRGLMWIARNISSPTAINWIRTYGGNAAANATLKHSRYLSRLLAYIARYERISINGVYDRVRGALIGIRVHPTAASGIAWAIKQGLKVLI